MFRKTSQRIGQLAARALCVALVGLAGSALPLAAQPQDEAAPAYASDKDIGIEQKLGEMVPLDLTFIDEAGQPVVLRDLIDKPVILTLVYLRCPSICAPLLHELAKAVDETDIAPGVDYDILTVSFDITDDASLSTTAKKNLLQEIDRDISPDSWRFLTGEADQIARLTDAVGFRFRQEKQDFVHAGTVIFLSPDGKIVRYLSGERILPANLKMAVIDAAEGRTRSVMQRLQKLCYAYDAEGQTYILKVNRIILLVTLPLVGTFLCFLLFKKKVAVRT